MQIAIINSLPLRAKLAILPVILLGTLTIVVTEITTGINNQREDATLINAAGRQRMLNQRYVKEVMYAANNSTQGVTNSQPTYLKTLDLFTGSLNALTEGGMLVVNPGKNITKNIPAARDPVLIESLQENLQLVLKLEQKAMNYLRSAQNGKSDGLEELLTLNATLHNAANNAVQLFVAQSNNAIDRLIWKCIYLSLFASLIAIAASYIIGRSISHPVELFRNSLMQAAQGNLEETEPLNRRDEFGEMSKDLGNTLSAVREALGSSNVDWVEVASLFTSMKTDLQSVRAIITQVPTTMLMLDNNGTVSYMNPQAQKDVALLTQKGVFKSGFKANDNISQPQFGCEQLWQLCTEKSQLPCSEIKQLGDEHLELSIYALLDDNGGGIGTLVSWQIVTDNVKRQQALDLSDQEDSRKAIALKNLIDELHVTVQAAAQGNLGQRVALGEDEKLNDIARTINLFIQHINRDMSKIQQSSIQLLKAATRLSTAADSLDISAEKAHQMTTSVANDSESVDNYMTQASTATEQMSTSIREIGNNTSSADQVAQEAVSLTKDATVNVQQLFESSSDIGNVLKFITSIAEQTNLLALNATIEAARAGDAGKGFAVVANEVKELAKQTANATDEIGARINSIQSDSTRAVQSIQDINDIVLKISSYQGTIATAITQQTTASREISQTIGQTANSSSNISRHADELVRQNQTSAESLATSREATKDVVGCAQQLETLLSHYQLDLTKSQ